MTVGLSVGLPDQGSLCASQLPTSHIRGHQASLGASLVTTMGHPATPGDGGQLVTEGRAVLHSSGGKYGRGRGESVEGRED